MEAPDGTSKDILKIYLTFACHSNESICNEAESKVLNFEDIKQRNFGYCDVGKRYELYIQVVLSFA